MISYDWKHPNRPASIAARPTPKPNNLVTSNVLRMLGVEEIKSVRVVSRSGRVAWRPIERKRPSTWKAEYAENRRRKAAKGA